jgi:hypothetical protein
MHADKGGCHNVAKMRVTSMGQEAKSSGYWRVNNSPTLKRVAKRQQTKQKSKCQLAAKGTTTQ